MYTLRTTAKKSIVYVANSSRYRLYYVSIAFENKKTKKINYSMRYFTFRSYIFGTAN